MRTVVITGGAGFIGSHLVDRYVSDEWNVVVLDNLLTGHQRNIEGALRKGAVRLVKHDVSESWDKIVTEVERDGKPELVLHFASPASPIDYGNYPIETLRVNSKGTENAALAALSWGARFLYASTSESYGDPKEHPQVESYWGNVNPVGVRSCYDESKRYGEAMVSTLLRTHALDGRIIRIFNTYGPRMALNDGRVVPNFVKQALSGQPLTVYGTGSQTRSFCYVSDLVEGIFRCASSERARGLVVNLGNPREERIDSFASIIASLVGVPLHVEHKPLPPDDPARRCPDIALARQLLDWSPVVALEDGLRQTILYFKALLPSTP